jgi:hypothetical protein
MHDGYANARPVRVPALARTDLGPAGWDTLHEVADLRGRPPRLQVLALLRWALWRSLQGDDTELTRAQLDELLGSLELSQSAEAAA